MTKSSKNAAAVYLSKWRAKSETGRTMRGAVGMVAEALGGEGTDPLRYPWHEVDFSVALSVAAGLEELGYSPSSVNKALTVLRGVLKTAWNLGQIDEEIYRRIEIKSVRNKPPSTGRALKHEEIDKLCEWLAHPDDVAAGRVGALEAAVVSVMLGCGLRRVEVQRLAHADYDAEGGRLTARGKNGKARSIPMAPRWRPAFEAWWRTHKGVLFQGDEGKPLHRHQLSYAVESFYDSLVKCGVTGVKRFTPHDLRRTFITRVCEESDIGIASTLAGHESIDTTKIYDRRGHEAEDEAVKKL